MEKSKDLKVFGMLCLMVSIVAISFAYASLTHTLDIQLADNDNGSGAKWEIIFDNISDPKVSGNAKAEGSPYVKSATTIANFETTFYTPGDSISYTFDVENKGTFNAMVSSIQITNPTCIGSDNDCRNVLKYVRYALTYEDGKEIIPGDILYSEKDSILGANNKKLKMSLQYSENISQSELPKNDVLLTNIEAVILYEQVQKG